MVEFKQVVEAVLEKEISFDDCAVLILEQGIDSMLTNILGSLEQTVLLASFQQMGSKYPTQTYGYVAETLRRGAAAKERERMRGIFGFRRPTNAKNEAQ